MGQMLSGAGPTSAMTADPTVNPQAGAGAWSGPGGQMPVNMSNLSDPSASAAAGEHPTVTNLKNNMSFLSRMVKMFGDTPEEQQKNAEALSSMMSDFGSGLKTMGQTSLARRMMTHQMRPIAELSQGGSAGGVAQIPPEIMAPIMAQMGFK